MRVLLTDYYGLGYGGAEMNTYMIAKALHEKGIEPIIASTGNYEEIGVRKFKSYPLPVLFFQKSYLKDFLKKIIEKENVDIVHAMDRLTSVAAVLAARETGKKVIVHFNDHWFLCPRSTCIKPNGEQCKECSISALFSCMPLWRIPWEAYKLLAIRKAVSVIQNADHFFTNSSVLGKKLNCVGIKNAEIVPNFIDEYESSNEKNEELARIKKFKIGFVGRLSYEKGIGLLIEIMKGILEKRKDVYFVIVGEGEMKKQIENAVADAGVANNVRIMGNVKRREIIGIFSSLDAVIVPSILEEPFGRVAVEAMAARKTVIASNRGFFRELIDDGKNGLLAEPDNAEEWIKKIGMLMDNEKIRNAIAEKGWETSRLYGKERVINKILSSYKEC